MFLFDSSSSDKLPVSSTLPLMSARQLHSEFFAPRSDSYTLSPGQYYRVHVYVYCIGQCPNPLLATTEVSVQ